MKHVNVAICLTSYNNEKCIEETLLSCLKQETEAQVTVYIVDDGSNDQTPLILEQMRRKWKNLKVKIEEHRERGVTRQDVINMALLNKPDFLLFIDSDMKLDSFLVQKCLTHLTEDISALVVPEIPYSRHQNYMTKVKVFERSLINSIGKNIENNSVEGARFWKTSEYIRSGGLNPSQISFEETQPTIRIQERGGLIKRAVDTWIYHDEGKVTLSGILKKKGYYFDNIRQTTTSEDRGFSKAFLRWYFFRPYLYSFQSLVKYLKSPHLFFGLMFMYIALSFVAIKSFLASTLSKSVKA